MKEHIQGGATRRRRHDNDTTTMTKAWRRSHENGDHDEGHDSDTNRDWGQIVRVGRGWDWVWWVVLPLRMMNSTAIRVVNNIGNESVTLRREWKHMCNLLITYFGIRAGAGTIIPAPAPAPNFLKRKKIQSQPWSTQSFFVKLEAGSREFPWVLVRLSCLLSPNL